MVILMLIEYIPTHLPGNVAQQQNPNLLILYPFTFDVGVTWGGSYGWATTKRSGGRVGVTSTSTCMTHEGREQRVPGTRGILHSKK